MFKSAYSSYVKSITVKCIAHFLIYLKNCIIIKKKKNIIINLGYRFG